MAIRTIEKKFDDLTGEELPDDTKPWRMNYQGCEYQLFLSPESRQVVDDFMGRLLRNASATSKRRSRPGGLAHVREWLRAQGYYVSERGAIRADLLDLYHEARNDPACRTE